MKKKSTLQNYYAGNNNVYKLTDTITVYSSCGFKTFM